MQTQNNAQKDLVKISIELKREEVAKSKTTVKVLNKQLADAKAISTAYKKLNEKLANLTALQEKIHAIQDLDLKKKSKVLTDSLVDESNTALALAKITADSAEKGVREALRGAAAQNACRRISWVNPECVKALETEEKRKEEVAKQSKANYDTKNGEFTHAIAAANALNGQILAAENLVKSLTHQSTPDLVALKTEAQTISAEIASIKALTTTSTQETVNANILTFESRLKEVQEKITALGKEMAELLLQTHISSTKETQFDSEHTPQSDQLHDSGSDTDTEENTVDLTGLVHN